jgi:hypothetical protein
MKQIEEQFLKYSPAQYFIWAALFKEIQFQQFLSAAGGAVINCIFSGKGYQLQ